MDDYEVSDAPRMTVNLKRLTRVLAKQWTEVSPEELYCQKVGVKIGSFLGGFFIGRDDIICTFQVSDSNSRTSLEASRLLLLFFFVRFGKWWLFVGQNFWRPWNIKEDYDQ